MQMLLVKLLTAGVLTAALLSGCIVIDLNV